MSVPFKNDPAEFSGRKLLAENVFDLLEKDDDCFIYEDIFSYRSQQNSWSNG